MKALQSAQRACSGMSARLVLGITVVVVLCVLYLYSSHTHTYTCKLKNVQTLHQSHSSEESDQTKDIIQLERESALDTSAGVEHAYQSGAIVKHSHNPRYPLMLYDGFDDSPGSADIIGAHEGVANVLFFVWCGSNRLFEFKHMLAVLSAIKVQQPLKVIVYHWPNSEPREDLYNTWLTELRETFYNFETSVLPSDISEPTNCNGLYQTAKYLSAIFAAQPYGGIYLSENLLLRRPVNDLRYQTSLILRSNGFPAVLIGRNVPPDYIVTSKSAVSCTHPDNMQPDTVCVSLDIDKLYPKDIMNSDVPFHAYCRRLFYGSDEKIEPHYDLSDPIPNIGHFYLIGENKVNFFIYLSIYSMISVLEVDTVYVHGDVEPTGDYWTKLLRTSKVKFVFCPPVEKVFGNKIGADDKFHGKDILSIYFLYVYGGVFIDWDAIFTRKLDDSIRGYDAVIGFDWLIPEEGPTFPEVINPGVLAAKRHSVFISMWLEKYKQFGKGGFYYTGLLVPYKLFEHYPETVRLEPRFQVICWQHTCHPPWMAGYNKPEFHSEFDWQDVYSVHFTYPDPAEFYSEAILTNSTTMIGRMGQKVLMGNNIEKTRSDPVT